MMRAFSEKIAAAAAVLWLALGGAQAGDWPGRWGSNGDCGCTRPRVAPPPPTMGVVYPICFYDIELGAVDTAKSAWPQYSKKLEAVLLARVRNKKRVTIVSSRSAVAWTTKYAHRQLARVWPEIACMGQSGGGDSETRRQACVKFIGTLVKSRVENSPMPPGALEPVCQTFLTNQ